MSFRSTSNDFKRTNVISYFYLSLLRNHFRDSFEHFSLSQEIPEKKTQLSTTQTFFSKGFFLGTFKDEVINRPYALSFGGLNFFPWGIWWLCLLGALATSCLNQKSKLALLSLSVFISGGAFPRNPQERSLFKVYFHPST